MRIDHCDFPYPVFNYKIILSWTRGLIPRMHMQCWKRSVFYVGFGYNDLHQGGPVAAIVYLGPLITDHFPIKTSTKETVTDRQTSQLLTQYNDRTNQLE